MSRTTVFTAAAFAVAFAASAQAQTVRLSDCVLRVLFPAGSSSLTASQEADIAAFLSGTSGGAVSVVGYNNARDLARSRAVSVATEVQSLVGPVSASLGVTQVGGQRNNSADVLRDGCVVAQIPAGSTGVAAAGAAAGAGAGAGAAVGAGLAAGGLGPAFAALGAIGVLGALAAGSGSDSATATVVNP